MPERTRFLDPVKDPAFPLRALFSDGKLISREQFLASASNLVQELEDESLLTMASIDPLITKNQAGFRFNWPGWEAAVEVLGSILDRAHQFEGLSFRDSLESLIHDPTEPMVQWSLDSKEGLCSFLSSFPEISSDATLDESKLALMSAAAASLGVQEDSDEGDVRRVISFLESRKGYTTLDEIVKHCDLDPNEREIIEFQLDSERSIIRVGDLYTYCGRGDVVWVSENLPIDGYRFCSVSDLYRRYEVELTSHGYSNDYQLARDLEAGFPESRSSCFGVLDPIPIMDWRNARKMRIINNRVSCSTMNLRGASIPEGFLLKMEQMRGSSINIYEFRTMIAENGLDMDTVMMLPYVVSVGESVILTKLDPGTILEILMSSLSSTDKMLSIFSVMKRGKGFADHGMSFIECIIQVVSKNLPELYDFGSMSFDVPLMRYIRQNSSGEHVAPELAHDIWQYVREGGTVNLFHLKKAFSQVPGIEGLVARMVKEGHLRYVPKGLEVGTEPQEVQGPTGPLSRVALSNMSHESVIGSSMRFESAVVEGVRDVAGYNPQSAIPDVLDRIEYEDIRDILKQVLFTHDVPSNLESNQVERILEVCDDTVLERDVELFSIYDIPSNMMIYLFNRSPEYYTLMSLSHDPGIRTPEELMSRILAGGVMVNRSETSDKMIDLRERLYSIIESFNYIDLPIERDDESDFRCSILFLLNDYEVQRSLLTDLYWKFRGSVGTLTDETAMDRRLPVFLQKGKATLRYQSPDDIVEVNRFIIEEIGCNTVSIDKFLKKRVVTYLSGYGIYGKETLVPFLDQYGLVRSDGGSLNNGYTLDESLLLFAQETRCINKGKLVEKYLRAFGGEADVVESAASRVCGILGRDTFDGVLSDSQMDELRDSLAGYQWITESNARSIVEDKLGHRGKYDPRLLANTGFIREDDVFYRSEYKNFKECLRENEFSGDDLYITNELRVRFDCEAMRNAIRYYEVNLMWVPVSRERFVNLRSDRFEYLYEGLKKYRKFINEVSRDLFITPYSLKNMESGISEIDEDEFELVFYEAALFSARIGTSTIMGQRFFFSSGDSDYRCVAPDFIRYVVDRNDGRATLSEVQAVLKEDYGIGVELPMVRYMAKQSGCILLDDLDIVYSSEERYLEDATNVQ